MPLEKEFSIVADSTVSSSPPPDVDDDSDASTVVKRPARTYGKRREEPQEKSLDTPLSCSNSTSRDSFLQTAPPGLSEEIAATPLRIHREDSNAGSTDIDDESSQTPFVWGWKADLARIDRDEDTEHVRISSESTFNDLPMDTVFGRPVLLQDVSATATNQNVVPDQSVSPFLPVPSNDIFGGGTFSGPSSSPGPHAKRSFVLSSPLLAPTNRARHFNDKSDLDSDGEPSKASSSNTPSSSSQPLHNINTPKSKSSYTSPPTSDDDMPANVLPKGRSSGKRKRLSTRSDVPQLDLIETPLSEPKTRNAPAEKKGKIKGPTKRDNQEMIKERSRLAAESNANIPRQTVGKYTKERLFKTIGEASRRTSAPSDNLEPGHISDPIEAYSSPVNIKTIGSIHAPGPSRLVGSSKISPMPRSPGELDSDGEDLPEVPDIFKEVAEKKKKELLAAKLRALKQRKILPNIELTNDDDDDLGLEIVRPNPRTGIKDEDERRRSPKKSFISETRKQQLQLAHVNPKQKMIKSSVGVGVRRMQVDPASEIFQHGGRTDQQTLSRVVGLRAQADARKLASLKQEQWKKHGGRIAERPEIQAEGYSTVLKTIADKGLEIVKDESRMYVEDEDEDEDGSNADWDPELRGSASPELGVDEDEVEEAEGLDKENAENMAMDPDATMVEDDLEVPEGPKSRSNRRSLIVVPSDSEEEGDENDENMSVHPVASSTQERYRRATSSCELPTEDEQDKENNTILMYDRSEDKENTAVVRHGPLSFSENEMASPSQSPSTTSRDWIPRAARMDDGRSAERRKPFQELISDEIPSSQSLASTLTQSFAAKLQQSSQLPNTLAATPLQPFLGGRLQSEKSFGSFSQFSEGDSDPFGAAPLLEPGFSDLFESGTEKQTSKARKMDLSSDEALSDENDLTTLKRTYNLGLTQDVNAVAHLQPAFQDGRLMRKADAIFEKEQAFVVEAAIKKPANQKPELYVNDHGFLTQTRPAEGTPEVYRPILQTKYDTLRGAMISPSQPPQPRPPLRTLSMTGSYQPESPDGRPLRRLRKNVSPPRDQDDFPTGHGSISNTPPRRQNAFDMLARGAAKAQRRAELKQKQSDAGMNEYFENEAAESDEDDAFGFGRAKRDDEDEDGEDLDKTLDELMDDNAMDEDTVAADLVLEKFKEQEEAQDQEDERLHMAAIQGELRRKRARGVGVDDSDDDSEDDGNEKARRAMKKLRTTDRGDIKHLEANEATRSFAETYNQTLKDDDDEFAYLNKESQIDDVLNAGGAATYSDDDDDEEEEEEEPQPRTISADEIKRSVRAMAEKIKTEEEDEVAMDPEDLSWLDEDDDEDTPRVKTVTARPRPRDQLKDQELDGTLSGLLRKSSEPMNASSKQWYAQENKSRNAGTSRSVGGSAITGHARAKPKGSSRTASESVSASTTAKKPVKVERSMLSAIADKSRHFA